jgi:small conductance mechanosensitive channel
MIDFQSLTTKGIELAMLYIPKVLLAIITLLVGLWVIKMIAKAIQKALERSQVELTLRRFLGSFASSMLKILLVISVISMLGVQMTSFIAILGAAGLAVGLALQGSLANFAGGVLVLLFRPYKVGDVIEAQGYIGSVHSIQIFNTVLKTYDNKTIIIPNGDISNASIVNYSAEPKRLVDISIGIGYEDDIDKARDIVFELISKDNRILQDPAPTVRVKELGDSSVNFTVRMWCESAHYWDIFFDMHEKVKKAFDANGISIPYPQQDVHLYKHE